MNNHRFLIILIRLRMRVFHYKSEKDILIGAKAADQWAQICARINGVI